MSILDRSPLAAAQKALETNPDVVASAANMAQSTAGLVPVWKASTAYIAGQRAIAPNGDVVAAKVAFTSGAAYDAANWNASTQDGRLGTLEGMQPVKAVKLESGQWVWGTAGATHYVIQDHTGSLIVRATAQPVPASTPALNW